MEKKAALEALAALAQDSRIDIFRLLVAAGPDGMAAGAIAGRLGLAPATLSFHLSQLRHAGLATCRRDGRSLIYSADYGRMAALMDYLTENCCGGRTGGCAVTLPSGPAIAKETELDVTIYHNPKCGTSRNTLALIRNAGIEPRIVEYLAAPPDRARLLGLIESMGMSARDLLRRKGTPYDELGLDDPAIGDDRIVDLMLEHPILIERPVVETPLGVRLCRPSEVVLDILPAPQRGAFVKENGEAVVDEAGNRLR